MKILLKLIISMLYFVSVSTYFIYDDDIRVDHKYPQRNAIGAHLKTLSGLQKRYFTEKDKYHNLNVKERVVDAHFKLSKNRQRTLGWSPNTKDNRRNQLFEAKTNQQDAATQFGQLIVVDNLNTTEDNDDIRNADNRRNEVRARFSPLYNTHPHLRDVQNHKTAIPEKLFAPAGAPRQSFQKILKMNNNNRQLTSFTVHAAQERKAYEPTLYDRGSKQTLRVFDVAQTALDRRRKSHGKRETNNMRNEITNEKITSKNLRKFISKDMKKNNNQVKNVDLVMAGDRYSKMNGNLYALFYRMNPEILGYPNKIVASALPKSVTLNAPDKDFTMNMKETTLKKLKSKRNYNVVKLHNNLKSFSNFKRLSN